MSDATAAPSTSPVPAVPSPGTGAPRKTRVAVLFGGRSGEHAISASTASGVLRAIDRDRYDVVPVGITREGRWVIAADDPERWQIAEGRLPEVTADTGAEVVLSLTQGERTLRVLEPGQVPALLGEVDVVFPLLHGPFGEDGTVQGLLELADVHYVGAGVLASAVGMDKHFMKLVLAGQGLAVGPYVVLRPRDWERDRAACVAAVEPLGLPLFVKPARAGSSLGITRVDDLADLPAAVEAARVHDPKVIVEAGIEGREIECAVLGGRDGSPARASLPGEIVVDHDSHAFYDFEAKYLDEAHVDLSCPADLPAHVLDEVREVAVRTFEAVEAEGLSRVDVFVTPDERVVVNEINTMPGFTPFSMYPRMWEASGVSYAELVDELIQLALERPTGLR
ncbi:D-alanine--D-alanine ligase [Isoptericola sp. 4D.3]|uniref:D-alanine--D-alanine ligase n=1 Tax=Isoptericola peretonis TaxID=2918523 RepID=A0ABT0J0K1_9MICO|nr:D-alanine--D-alanine ligase [Isoptericola sp. 4D.3]